MITAQIIQDNIGKYIRWGNPAPDYTCGHRHRYIEIDTKGRFALLVTPPKKEEGKIIKRQYGVLAKFDGAQPAMRPVWADARMCSLCDDETPTASQISTAWGLVADVLKYSHDQEYQELTALLK